MALTASQVQQRTKISDLRSVKHLNLWGMNIEDVSVMAEMPNLQVLSLSVNKIKTLKDFVHCPRLTELYLRKNEVADLDDLKHLAHLPHLKVLWLSDNPVAEMPGYLAAVRQHAPGLTKLDNADIAPAASPSPENPFAAAAAAVAADSAAAAALPEAQPSLAAEEGAPFARRERIPRGEMAKGAATVERSLPRPVELPAASEPVSPSPRARALPTTPPRTAEANDAQPMPGQKTPPPTPPAASVAHGAGPQSNIMYACIALVAELNEEALRVLQADVAERLVDAQRRYNGNGA